jgi:hypothetical protein
MSRISLSGDAAGTGTFTIASPNSNSNFTLTLPIESGTVLTSGTTSGINASALTTGTIPKARMFAGAVLQVLQTQKTDTFSTTSTTFVDVTGLSVSITPASASNKILVMVSVSVGPDQHSDLRILRDSTAIAIGDTAGARTRSTNHFYRGFTGGQYDVIPSNMVWLDSPATTSALTYKIQVGNPYSGAYTTTINRTAHDGDFSYNARTVSTITVMEIAA